MVLFVRQSVIQQSNKTHWTLQNLKCALPLSPQLLFVSVWGSILVHQPCLQVTHHKLWWVPWVRRVSNRLTDLATWWGPNAFTCTIVMKCRCSLLSCMFLFDNAIFTCWAMHNCPLILNRTFQTEGVCQLLTMFLFKCIEFYMQCCVCPFMLLVQTSYNVPHDLFSCETMAIT